MSAISRQTMDDLRTVVDFFGCDLEWNRHIFRHASEQDANAFEITIGNLAAAIRNDARHGITHRIRQQIEAQRKAGRAKQ